MLPVQDAPPHPEGSPGVRVRVVVFSTGDQTFFVLSFGCKPARSIHGCSIARLGVRWERREWAGPLCPSSRCAHPSGGLLTPESPPPGRMGKGLPFWGEGEEAGWCDGAPKLCAPGLHMTYHTNAKFLAGREHASAPGNACMYLFTGVYLCIGAQLYAH